MPSFDVVSEVDQHELSNAIDQTNREVGNRFDFKGTDSKVTLSESTVTLESQSDFQLKQILDVLYQKLAKRGIDISALEPGKVEESNNRARQSVALKEGIDKELAKKIVKMVKESKIKVQASVQGEQVRVTGKKRDDLQQAIALLKGAELGQPLQFNNFRD